MRKLAPLAILLAFALAPGLAQSSIKIAVTPSSSASIRNYVVKAYERIGIAAELVEVPTERARALFNSGEAQALMFERPEVISTLQNALLVGSGKDPFFTFSFEAYVRSDDSDSIKSLADLKGKKLGIVRGLRLDGYVKALGGEAVEAESVDSLVKMLLARRIDAIVSATNSLTEVLKTNNAESRIQAIKELVSETKYYHVISNKYASKKDLLSEEFRKTTADLKKIMGIY